MSWYRDFHPKTEDKNREILQIQAQSEKISIFAARNYQTMDTPKVLTQAEALDIVREYKQAIEPLFDGKVKVYLYGSYSKGNANPWSDIDVAVIIPTLEGDWLKLSIALNRNVRKVNLRIEPVLMIENQWSPLYEDVMLTGIAV